MKVLGIRNAPKQVRYAVVTFDGTNWALENAASENILPVPATMTELAAQLKWTHDELTRVIRVNPGIDLIGLKTSEFRGNETLPGRTGNYLDAMVLLVAAEQGIPVVPRLYNQLAATRATVMGHAETRVGRTATAWNHQMADAVAVAWIIGK